MTSPLFSFTAPRVSLCEWSRARCFPTFQLLSPFLSCFGSLSVTPEAEVHFFQPGLPLVCYGLALQPTLLLGWMLLQVSRFRFGDKVGQDVREFELPQATLLKRSVCNSCSGGWVSTGSRAACAKRSHRGPLSFHGPDRG